MDFIKPQAEQLYHMLYKKYDKHTLNKYELSQELGISQSCINSYIAKGYGIPSYLKIGKSKNARVLFNIIDVAEFLSQTIKTS